MKITIEIDRGEVICSVEDFRCGKTHKLTMRRNMQTGGWNGDGKFLEDQMDDYESGQQIDRMVSHATDIAREI